MISSLHASLGRTDSVFDLALVEEACEKGVAETEQHDWKSSLPLPAGPARNDTETRERALELAKDMAAMANGRGGLLVYGVREDGGGHAAEVVGVEDLADGEMVRRVRQVAYNLIYPPVQVGAHQIVEEKRVLVITVEESDEAPHLVQPRRDGGNDGWLMAPHRVGADTQNMVEKQIETAYRQRFEGRRLREANLRDRHRELMTRRIPQAEAETGTVVVFGQPIHPRRGVYPGARPDQTAMGVLDGAATLCQQLAGQQALAAPSLIATLLSEPDTARRSLRRFVLSRRRGRAAPTAPHVWIGKPGEASVELHDDGAIGLTWRRGAMYPFVEDELVVPPTPSIGEGDMDMVTLMLLALVLETREALEFESDYQIRVALLPNTPIALIPEGGLIDGDYTMVPPAPVVDAELRLGDGPEVRASDLLTFNYDLNNMIERSHCAFERFWELPLGTHHNHPRRQLARYVLGGEPNHPVTGKTMS